LELSDPEKKILETLRLEPGLNTSQIAERLRSSRQTTGKYLELLELKNLVTRRETGPVKLWFESKESGGQLDGLLDYVNDEIKNWLLLRDAFLRHDIDEKEYLHKMEEHMRRIREAFDAK